MESTGQHILFSVIIPTYNRADFILTTINSVFMQTYPNFELIVIDDGSTDDTESIVKAVTDKRFTYCRKNNEERAAARNYGVQLAKGDYITFLDSDDIMLPSHLQEALDLIKRESSPEWFHLKYKITDTRNRLITQTPDYREENLNKILLTGNFLSCIGVFIQSAIAKANLFNTNRGLSGSEDHELWMRLAAQYPLKTNRNVTAILVDHNARSVINIDIHALVKRQNIFLDLILSNPMLKSFIHENENKLKSNSYSYISLHIALTGKHKRESFIYLTKSFQSNASVIFSRRFLAIVKHLAFTY